MNTRCEWNATRARKVFFALNRHRRRPVSTRERTTCPKSYDVRYKRDTYGLHDDCSRSVWRSRSVEWWPFGPAGRLYTRRRPPPPPYDLVCIRRHFRVELNHNKKNRKKQQKNRPESSRRREPVYAPPPHAYRTVLHVSRSQMTNSEI